MDKILYGKWGGWIAPVGVLFRLIIVITAQPGFLSISCGGKTNYTENNITWVSDADYIDVGETADIGNVSQGAYGTYLHNLRLFPKPLTKSCYQLPVAPDVPYLLRLWFAAGNYKGFKQLPSFAFSIETLGLLATVQTTPDKYADKDAYYDERIFVSSGTVLYICLIRTFESDDPFISAIELRTFQHGMYGQAKPGTMLLPRTYDLGGNSEITRYPLDKFDRIWIAKYLNGQTIDSSQEAISTNNTKNLPPNAVMQTAWVGNSWNIDVNYSGPGTRSLLLLYFAEIETFNMSKSRSFYVTINGERGSETIYTLMPNNSTLELTFLPYQIGYFNVVKAPNSTLGPILNAFEHHWLYDTDQATYSQDIDALRSIKMSFDIKDWISDPCYSIPWKGIGCNNSSSSIRISEIDLSRRNLIGPVPKGIGQLTALVNVSMDNNHLIGTFPNFSNLTMLERLYLQNNNLSGSVPEWLSELKNLKELNIDYNNFSGAIPTQLFLNCSLKLSYSGNLHLRMDKRKCTVDNSSNNKLKVVLAITLSGFLIATLALIAGVVVCLKKLKRKGDGLFASKSSRMEKETKPFMRQDYSSIMVPNPPKSRVFTLDEMITATQKFSREIGRGGFGSVFFGKLPEGRYIAVKVLSLFSRQGVHEFFNEVDLLSRINHRSLVSLVGYCNETREVMLIYEHMSGGSLRDHLYGLRAKNSELNWKTRLKIALDAAHGLEYLHMGCTPKIIHRDVKTANILLDSNMNGKLADFGLSRMTIEEEATHVSTVVKGTIGYIDPEYFSTKMLTEKSDVYSFGVVLLEIICGRQPIDIKLPEEEVNIIRWVTPYIAEMDENASKITEIIDKRMGGGYDMKSVSCVAEVAMRSVHVEPSWRPSMREVVGELKKAMEIEDYKASISEEIGIEGGDFLAGSVDSTKRKGMEWSDNSSNISKVGR